MKNLLLLIFLLNCSAKVFCQSAAIQLLDKSIAYHDPNDRWEKWSPELSFTVLYPGKSDAKRFVYYDNKKGSFLFRAEYAEGDLVYQVEKGTSAKALWNDSEEVPEKMAKQYRIAKDRALMYRNYYTYLYGMPMKLKDPGTKIHPDVTKVTKLGIEYNKIKVTYEESVGKDTWYFYFDPNTNALQLMPKH